MTPDERLVQHHVRKVARRRSAITEGELFAAYGVSPALAQRELLRALTRMGPALARLARRRCPCGAHRGRPS